MKPRAPGPHAITFVFITVLIDMIGIGLIMPVLPKIIETVSGEDLASATLLGGWLYFAYGGMQFLFGPTLGNLSDAYGRRPVLLLSVFGMAIDYLLTAFAPTMLWLFIGRIVAGLCGASYTTASAYLADVTSPENRAKAFGMIGAAFGIGFVIGPAIGGLLGEFGPRVPFFVAAGLSFLNFLYGWLVLPETLPPEKRRPFELARANPLGTLKVFANYPSVLPLCLVFFLYFFASAVYPAIWPFWAIARFAWSEAIVGLTLAAFGLVSAIFAGALTGPIVKRYGEWRVALIGLIVAAFAAAGYGFSTGLAFVMILVVFHGPEGFVHPAVTALMSKEAPPDAQGELQGGIASIQSIAMLLGSVMFAQVFGYFSGPSSPYPSTSVAFFLAAALMALATLLFAMQRKTKKVAVTPP